MYICLCQYWSVHMHISRMIFNSGFLLFWDVIQTTFTLIFHAKLTNLLQSYGCYRSEATYDGIIKMEQFSALLAICVWNSTVTGEFPAQRPVTRSFDVFYDLCLNEFLSKQSWGWWFETPSCPLWRHSSAWGIWVNISRESAEKSWFNHIGTNHNTPGPWFNIKMLSYRYRKSHCGDKTVVRSSYLHNGISYTGKMSSLYRIGALGTYFERLSVGLGRFSGTSFSLKTVFPGKGLLL